jgi:diguanylate cyclase (GGDEF)-like protein
LRPPVAGGSNWPGPRRALNFDADALADNRDRIGRHLSGLTAVLLSSFFILHALAGRWTMAAVNFGPIVSLWINARAPARSFTARSVRSATDACHGHSATARQARQPAPAPAHMVVGTLHRSSTAQRFAMKRWFAAGIVLVTLLAAPPPGTAAGFTAPADRDAIPAIEQVDAAVSFDPTRERREALAWLNRSFDAGTPAARLSHIWWATAASREVEEYDDVTRWVDIGIALALQLKAHEAQCALGIIKGSGQDAAGAQDLALKTLDGAIACAREHDQPKILVYAMAEKARTLRGAGRSDDALKLMSEAYQRAEARKDSRQMAVLLNDISIFHSTAVRPDWPKAAELNLKALSLLDADTYRSDASNFHHNLARAYDGMGRRAEALKSFRTGLDLAKKTGYAVAVAIFTYRIAEIERDEGRAKEALADFEAALPTFIATKNNRFALETLLSKATLLATLARPSDSLAALAQARGLLNAGTEPKVTSRFHRDAAQTHATLRDFESAYREIQLLVQSQYREGQASNEQLLEEYKVRFDVQRKEAENAMLRLRDAEVGAQRLVLGLSLVLALVVAASLGIYLRQQVRQKQRFAELAMRDELTRLRNRRSILEWARGQVAQSLQADVPLSIGLLDIDHFKKINDSHGHDVGDAVLMSFADACQKRNRGTDGLGRYGGEEFMLVMPGTRAHEVVSAFEGLRQAVGAIRVPAMAPTARVSFSMGAAQLRPGDTVESLIQRADVALYAAKRGGRDRLEVDGPV